MFNTYQQGVDKTSSPYNFADYEEHQVGGRTIPVVTVCGTAYDRGRWYGRLLASKIQKNCRHLNRTKIFLSKSLGISLEEVDQKLEEICKNMRDVVSMDHFAEIAGICDGCKEMGFPLENERTCEIFVAAVELGELQCTLFAANHQATKDGHTYHLRNLDYPLFVKSQQFPVVVVHIPQDQFGHPIGIPYASFTCAGYVGVHTGINAKGVCFGQNRGIFFEPKNLLGKPFLYIVEDLLIHANNAMEAEQILFKSKRGSAHFVVISDPQGSKDSLKLIFCGSTLFNSVGVNEMPVLSEIRKKTMRFYQPLENLVYWMTTENISLEGVPVPDHTPDALFFLLQESWGKINSEVCQRIGSELGWDNTIISAIFDSTDLQVWCAFASEKIPAHKQNYLHLDLNKYFSMQSGHYSQAAGF